MRHITLILLATLAGAPFLAAEDALPPAVSEELAEFDADILKARENYEEDVADAVEDLSKRLERMEKKATRAGELEIALALKKKREEMAAFDPYQPRGTNLLSTVPTPTTSVISKMEAEALATAMRDGEIDAATWERLGGVEIEANTRGTRTRIVVQPGETYLMIPHPEDRWANANVTWQGEAGIPNYIGTNANRRALVWKVGNAWNGDLMIESDAAGPLMFQMLVGTVTEDGTIRVKIFQVEE